MPAFTPVSVHVVVPRVATAVPFRLTRYEVTPVSSVAVPQVSVTFVDWISDAAMLDGAVGGVVSGGGEPSPIATTAPRRRSQRS